MSWVPLAVSVAAALVNVAIAVSLWRTARRTQAELAQVQALRNALGRLCVDTFQLRDLPMWRLWGATMGAVKITVTGRDREIEIGDESAQSDRP